MAVLYKYFNEDILTKVFSISESDAEEYLGEIKDWAFIKNYEYGDGSHSYFLHDVLREMINHYYWTYEETKSNEKKKEKQKIYKDIIDYYENLFMDITKKEQMKIDKYEKSTFEERNIIRMELTDIQRRRQSYKADQVYYHICDNFDEGLKSYREVHTNNIWGAHSHFPGRKKF